MVVPIHIVTKVLVVEVCQIVEYFCDVTVLVTLMVRVDLGLVTVFHRVTVYRAVL